MSISSSLIRIKNGHDQWAFAIACKDALLSIRIRRPKVHYRRCFLSALLLVSSISLSGCIDLSGSRATYTKQAMRQRLVEASKKKKPEKIRYRGAEVHTMRGGLGIFSIGMNQLRDKTAKQYHIPSYSTMWYNAGDVSQFIIHRYYQQNDHRPVILIGHSLGANEQIKVARNLETAGIPVALLVTVDAVSQTIVPANVKQALNLYKPGFVPMFSGLKLRAVDPQKTKIDNVNVALLKNVRVNHFTIDKDALVQAMILDRVQKGVS